MIKEGDYLPNIILRSVTEDGIKNIILHQEFQQKKNMLFKKKQQIRKGIQRANPIKQQ